MLEVLDNRILLLILSLLTNIESTKLSDQKKCGDPECETPMSRVQAIKDHIGPDCRFLNFKTGEEIMVHFKLSRTREDLWAGSKGQDFGYFPVDAIRVEEIFTTKEVEVPTKETDFFCLDGGEYMFENEDSIFNHDDEETDYIPLYTDEDDSEYEALRQREISFGKEFKEPFSDSDEFDSKSKDLHTVETASYSDSELGYSKIGQDETIQQEDQGSQILKPVPTQPTWTVSGIAGWLGLRSKQNEEAAGKTSEATGQIIFRRRKLAITEDSDLKKLNDEDKTTEPRDSGWFQSSLPDFLSFGSEKSGLGLLHKENDPEPQDSSTITGDVDLYVNTIASETRKEGHGESEAPTQNWFNLDLPDVFTFGYSTENKVRREEYAGGIAADQNEEPLPLSSQLTETSTDEGSRKPRVASILSEEQHKENHVQETPGTEVKKTKSEVQLANQHTNFNNAADTSFSTDPTDKQPQYQYAEQDSISDSQVMENINIKTIMESGRQNDQSGVTNKEILSGNTPTEKHPLKSDKEPNRGQHSAVYKIPPVKIEEIEHTSLKNGQLDLKEELPRSNPMTENYIFSNGKEWLFQITLYLNDFGDLIISVLFSTMTSISKKI